MNPAELRMMWMSQYTPERITIEDGTSFYGQPSVGLSVMDDLGQPTTMEMNPMMSIVGGDYGGQAATAAAMGVQPTTLIAANPGDLYGITQVGGLQQVLQQPSVFQTYAHMIDDDGDIIEQDDGTQYVAQDYDQIEDSSCFDNRLVGIPTKQEIINIDDFVMMNTNDSNSYDETEMITEVKQKPRSQKKTRKIEPINRPGLVLKTPIAYKGNIDPSVIPIQRDGMAVCERCGAIGVKHTFYTKSRRFCSMACARGELYALVCNENNRNAAAMAAAATSSSSTMTSMQYTNSHNNANNMTENESTESHTDLELDITVSHIKNSNYRFRFAEDSATSLGNGNDGTLPDELIKNGSEKLVFYRDIQPLSELPQIPKLEDLPSPCPQDEKICSVRRRPYDHLHSYDWSNDLGKKTFFAAPVTCFKHAPGHEMWDNIDVDMKVEVENTDCDSQEPVQPGQTPHSFWVATILQISGYKALVRYEGFDEASHDFWVNLCSSEVHQVGWCATRGKPLIPPRTIENKYSDWKDFLVERLSGARTLPSSFYNKINESFRSRFRVGLNLECVYKDCISQVRLATVQKIVGKRLFVKYFDSDDGFWCHEDSQIIHPVGWATTVGHSLVAPQNYLNRMKVGTDQMIEVHEDDATLELFKMNFKFEDYYMESTSFMEGMKLEAVDPLNLSSICAATVMSVLKFGYMMIRIDSYAPDASGSDWFCYHEKSPCIFPVGFCSSNQIMLTPPNGYEQKEFTWENYLRDTNSIPASEHLFHRDIPNHEFQEGMKVECADLMDPRLVCVATVARVVGRLLKIHFDGWTEEYDQWLDCESPDFYPVGWCILVGHKLEGRPPIQVQINKPAPKPKAKKQKKKKITKTDSSTGRSMLIKKEALDLQSEKLQQQQHQESDRLKIKQEMKSEPRYCEEEDDEDYDDDFSQSDQSATLPITPEPNDRNKLISNSSATNSSVAAKSTSPAPPTERKATSYIGNSSVTNSKHIPRLSETPSSEASAIANASSSNNTGDILPESWNVYDVSQFLRMNDCTVHCDTFSRSKIDGKRLLELSKDEIITLLGMKVGPALKIFDLIQQLKCKINPSKSRHLKANKFL